MSASPSPSPPPLDWGRGHYEKTAAELEPVAEQVVGLARVAPGERVLDIACGTGNAALIAARAGAEATGVDLAARLVDVARARAAAAGLSATFAVGDATALPFDGESFHVAVSIFGVIFAPDADRAFAELVRVLRPGGRAFVTAWLPEGAMFNALSVLGRAVAAVTGPPPERFPWHDEERMRALAARHGAGVDFENGEISFSAASLDTFIDEGRDHPMNIAGREVLSRAGTEDQVGADVRATFAAGNEDPSGFRITSRYRIVRIERP